VPAPRLGTAAQTGAWGDVDAITLLEHPDGGAHTAGDDRFVPDPKCRPALAKCAARLPRGRVTPRNSRALLRPPPRDGVFRVLSVNQVRRCTTRRALG